MQNSRFLCTLLAIRTVVFIDFKGKKESFAEYIKQTNKHIKIQIYYCCTVHINNNTNIKYFQIKLQIQNLLVNYLAGLPSEITALITSA